MKPETITFTGIDERTDVDTLQKIASEFKCVEFGVLYTTDPEGRNRYPSLDWIKQTARVLSNLALHICGRKARIQFELGNLDRLLIEFNRIQVNGVVDAEYVQAYCHKYRDKTIITQHYTANKNLEYNVAVDSPNHALLVDGSGGRGISPRQWLRPNVSKSVGFAGGLGPDNLTQQLRLISQVAETPSWIDMEGNIRTDDWFDLEKVLDCLRQYNAYQHVI